MQDPTLKFVRGRVKIPRFKYKCYVCSSRFFTTADLKTHKKKYGEKGCKYFSKIKAAKEKKRRKRIQLSKRMKYTPKRTTNDNTKDNFVKSDEGNVFSCKHCWKVFLSKRSLQEHINLHFQNSEIDQSEVEEFYNDYALLRPGIDPFLTTPDTRFEQEAVRIQARYDDLGPGPSQLIINNNTSLEMNMNPGVDVEKHGIQLLNAELSSHEYLMTLPEDLTSHTVECSTVEQAVCTTQPPNFLVNREHFSCNRCDNLFLTFESFGQHVVNEKCVIIGKCCLCRSLFPSNRALYEHVINRHSKYRVICNFCFKMFVSFENMQKHIIKKHHYF